MKKKATARGFICGCGDSKSVSVSDGSDKSPAASTATTTTATLPGRRPQPLSSSADTLTMASSSSSYYNDTDDTSVASTPTVAALLHQLSELEHGVRALDGIAKKEGDDVYRRRRRQRQRHRRSVSEGGGGGAGRLEESVAVVKESDDPLGDFRRSMLQMIVEKEIVGGDELRELLRRFLSLNSPRHHHLILRAFAEIWEEVFAGYERTPDLLSNNRKILHPPPSKS